MGYSVTYTQSEPIQGVSGLWSWLTGTDLEAEQQRGDQLDASLQEQNQRDLASGHYTQDIFDQAQANLEAGRTGNVVQQVQDEFTTSVREDVGGAISGVVGFATDVIPWQAVAVGLGALALVVLIK